MSEQPHVFDLAAAVVYVRGLGATGVTIHTIRSEIAAGRIPRIRIGKKFYLSKTALDAWISQAERRAKV
jgi:excisionase family DNA binding protein